jgi:HNH endonuclease
MQRTRRNSETPSAMSTAPSTPTTSPYEISLVSHSTPRAQHQCCALHRCPPTKGPIRPTPGQRQPPIWLVNSPPSKTLTNNLKCRERDGYACVITHANEPVQVAHLYPFSLRSVNSFTRWEFMWNFLEYFWEKEKVKTWFEAIFENGGTEVVSNMLLRHMHIIKGHSLPYSP